MAPMFEESDFIIVDKFSRKSYAPLKRWDVIVFVPHGKDIAYIKRIVWLPWETIKVSDGKVFVCKSDNEQCDQLAEDYLPKDTKTEALYGRNEFRIPTWSYVVFGDNRSHSTDSRWCFGLWCYSGANYLVKPEDIMGRVYVRLFPHTQQNFTTLGE